MIKEDTYSVIKNINFDENNSDLSGDIGKIVSQTVEILLESYYMSRTTLGTIFNLKKIIEDSDVVKGVLAHDTFNDATESVVGVCLHPEYFATQCKKVFAKVGKEYGEKFNGEFKVNRVYSLIDERNELLERGETKVVEMARRLKNSHIHKSKEWLKWQLDNLQKDWNDNNFAQMKSILLHDADICEENLQSLFGSLDNIPSEPGQ